MELDDYIHPICLVIVIIALNVLDRQAVRETAANRAAQRRRIIQEIKRRESAIASPAA